MDRHHRTVRTEFLRHGAGGGQRSVDAEADVSVRLLSAGAGGGAGDGARLDAAGEARHVRRRRRTSVVLCGYLDCGSDTGNQLGGMANGQVSGAGAASAGTHAASDLRALDGVFLSAWICFEAAAHATVLHGNGCGWGVRKRMAFRSSLFAFRV